MPALLVAAAFLGAGHRHAGGEPAAPDEPRRQAPLFKRLLPPAVFALAFWSADVGLHQWHALWPTDGTLRFLAVAAAAATLGLVHAARPSPPLAAALRLVLGAGIALGLLTPVAEQYMPRPLLIGLTTASALWLAGIGLIVERAHRAGPPAALPVSLAATALAGAPALYESRYAGGAMLAASLGAIAGGALLAALIRPSRSAPFSGALTVWLSLLAAILLVTIGYTDAPAPWALALIALAPLGVLAARLHGPAWRRLLAAGLASGLLAGGATVAVLASIPDDGDESSYDY